MTISSAIMTKLEERRIDLEVADRHGLASAVRGGGECLVFPFVRSGKVVRKKYRWFRDERRWEQDKGGVRCAWNEDVLRDEGLVSVPLIITEGEFDALAAIQSSFLRTISVPDGAPPPGERTAEDLDASRKYEWLREIKALLSRDRVAEIILATDGDENGHALMQDLSVQLGRFRCKFLTYPIARDPEARGRERLKDLNEVLQEYGERGVMEVLARAQWLRVDGVYRMSELPPLPASRIYEIGYDGFGDNYKLRLGDFAVFTGIPSMGKTTFVQDLCCRVADLHGLRIAWASFEQAPQRDHRRAFRTWFQGKFEWQQTEAEKADADAWIEARHVFMVPSEDDDVTLDWLLEKMEVAVVRHECSVIVIDPWNEMDHARSRDESLTEYVGRAIKTLKRFARQFQVHLIVVAHPTKSTKDQDGTYRTPTLYDISDSAHWYNKADLGVVVHKESKDNTTIKVAKSRYHEIIGRPGAMVMQFCGETRRFAECERLS